MRSLLFWILPPVAGAIIGYVTNALAIKMLFRPLNEIRFLGFRLPFTPGILPRERRKLADSIGGMVERELLTPVVLRERLGAIDIRGKIESTLGSYTTQLLNRPLADLYESKGGDFPLAELFGDFVNSDVFDSLLEEILMAWIGAKAASAEETENNFGSWFKSRIGAMVIPTVRDLIKSGLVRESRNHDRGEPSIYRQALKNIIEKYPGLTLGEFLSIGGTKKRKLDSYLAEKAAGALDENIEGILSSVDVKTLVSDRINSLDMLRVEKIILDVMAGQLQWINFFGAILGALIGLLEVLLSFITSQI